MGQVSQRVQGDLRDSSRESMTYEARKCFTFSLIFRTIAMLGIDLARCEGMHVACDAVFTASGNEQSMYPHHDVSIGLSKTPRSHRR